MLFSKEAVLANANAAMVAVSASLPLSNILELVQPDLNSLPRPQDAAVARDDQKLDLQDIISLLPFPAVAPVLVLDRPLSTSTLEECKEEEEEGALEESSNTSSDDDGEEEMEVPTLTSVPVLVRCAPQEPPKHFTFDDEEVLEEEEEEAREQPPKAHTAKRSMLLGRVVKFSSHMRSPTNNNTPPRNKTTTTTPSPSTTPTNMDKLVSSVKGGFDRLHKRAAHMAVLSPTRRRTNAKTEQPPAVIRSPPPSSSAAAAKEEEEEEGEFDFLDRESSAASPRAQLRMVGRLSQRLSGFSELDEDEDVKNMEEVLRPLIERASSPRKPAINWSEMSNSDEWL